MKNVWNIVWCAAVALTLSGCTKEIIEKRGDGTTGSGKTFPATFEFSVPEMSLVSDPGPIPINSQSKSALDVDLYETVEAGTRAELNPIAKESVVEGLWVLQFNDAQILVTSSYYPGSEIRNNRLSAPISEEPLSTIYFVANVSSTQFDDLKVGIGKLSDFEELTLKYANEGAVSNAGASLPMVGKFEGSPTTSPINITLTRLVAKITFTCKVDPKFSSESFLLQSIRLRNVSTLSSYKELKVPSGLVDLYPSSAAGNFMNYDLIGVSSSQAGNATEMKNTGITLVWYVPENLQGVISRLSNDFMKGYGNAPRNAAFIEMQGVYTKNGVRSEVSYNIYPGENSSNDFNLVRNHHYTIVATIRGDNDKEDLRVMKPEDLSAIPNAPQGTANCYMVHRAGMRYKFPAISGNGGTFVGTYNDVSYTYQFGKLSTSGYAPAVLWETHSQGSVIEPGSVSTLDGYVYFTTAGTRGESVREGNVLIGWNKNNVPAWSWHIWSTSYDPEEDYVTYFVDRSSSKFYHVMLHSLGANGSAPEGSVGRYGLLYQWGRKDPFIGAKTVSGGEHAETYNAPGSEWKEEAVGVTTSLEFEEGIAYITEHPTTRFTGWYSPIVAPAPFWGEESNDFPKTGFAPCPPGWRVPPMEMWTAVTQDSRNKSFAFNNGMNVYFDDRSSETTFYPASGSYSYAGSNMTIIWAGTNGTHWSRTFSGSYLARAYGVDISAGPSNGTNYRTFTHAIRCVRE